MRLARLVAPLSLGALLATLLAACAAGLTRGRHDAPAPVPVRPGAAIPGSADRGRAMFEYTCEACHYAESTTARAGPGLLGLYSHRVLRNGAAVTDANVERFIRQGTGLMPGYGDKLTPEQMTDVIAYLRSL